MLFDQHHDGVQRALGLRSATLLAGLASRQAHLLVDGGVAQGESIGVGVVVQSLLLIQDVIDGLDVVGRDLGRRLACV